MGVVTLFEMRPREADTALSGRPWTHGFPRGRGLVSMASRLVASLTLRPIGLLNRPRRPLSRGFDPASYPTEPLVSYQTNDYYLGGTFLHW
ncbi:hypothetical protein [Mesorhizobium sp.]|uniref:hypothetical protein n=1 Tax=Mesorhizobium sp. TaxID=1871066 RepID=UPI0025BB7825|nr:hypothetical protein [Mesorhizobium sp.]